MKGIAGVYWLAALVVGAVLVLNPNFVHTISENGPTLMSSVPIGDKLAAGYSIVTEPISVSIGLIALIVIIAMLWF